MTEDFRFLLLSAMYENGGNTTHRFLDGHPQMFVYPFESQLGTKLVADMLSSTFPAKYRWPVFDLAATAAQDYHAIIDEECKVRARTPHVSKFRDTPFDFSDDDRKSIYIDQVEAVGRSRANNMAAFFRATFEAWKDYRRTGDQSFYVGYSPVVVVDADKVLDDLPHGHVLHVARNPWSAYADTKRRPVPLSLSSYLLAWTLNQYHALLYQELYPGRMHVLRLEDILGDPRKTLGELCGKLGLDTTDSLTAPSFNSIPLDQVYPWGTIRSATTEANRATAEELNDAERDAVRAHAAPYLDRLDYQSFF